MKKSKVIMTGILCGLLVLMAGCSAEEKAPVVLMDGTYELKLGKSTVKDVKDAGFTSRYSSADKDIIKSGYMDFFYPVKDDLSYGTMRVGNKSSKDVPIDGGVVFEISLDYSKTDFKLGEVAVNGVDYKGYTRDQVKEAMGAAKLNFETEEWMEYKLKKNVYTFNFKDGSETLTGLRVSDGTKVEYEIK